MKCVKIHTHTHTYVYIYRYVNADMWICGYVYYIYLDGRKIITNEHSEIKCLQIHTCRRHTYVLIYRYVNA